MLNIPPFCFAVILPPPPPRGYKVAVPAFESIVNAIHALLALNSIISSPKHLGRFLLASSVYILPGTGHWKISSIEDPSHTGCIGGRMRPSSKALVDVAAVMQADPAIPASALRNQLLEKVGVQGGKREAEREGRTRFCVR